MIAIMINTKDRATELSLLLQSLRTQTEQNFDVFILDDQSQIPLQNFHFIHCIINRLREENHRVFVKSTDFCEGVSKARQKIVDWVRQTDKYEYLCRLDDDCVLEPDYLSRLLNVIDKGYDLASGVTVPMISPTFKREPNFSNNIINRVILDKDGNFIMNGDDCGSNYTDSVILPAHHFRSCALYKTEIHENVDYSNRLSAHGFREEEVFSFKLILEGYKIGVDTGAINYHQMTPSGGERGTQTEQNNKFNEQMLKEFTKENSEELRKLFPDKPMPSKLELSKENNLIL